MELRDRRALVTGAGGGIGRAIALALAREGAAVAMVGRTPGPLAETAALLRRKGFPAWHAVADVGSPEQVQVALDRLLEAWGYVDVLVNNAGTQGPIGPLATSPVEEWCSTVQTNLLGCYLCCRAVLPAMIGRGYGKIISLSGGGAVSPRPQYSAYSASKAGVVRLTETLAAELAGTGIDVNSVAPGAVNTRMLEETLAAGQAAGAAAQAEAQRQAASGGVDPRVPAELVVYLASHRSDGLTGRLLSAVWDPWREFDVAAIMAGDLYTVRRIVPADRMEP